MSRKVRSLVFFALVACAGPASVAHAACSQASSQPVMRLRVFSPLVMTEVGASTDVSVDGSGCVVARYPVIDKRHGEHHFVLPAAEFEALKREIRAARLDEIDAPVLKRTLGERQAKSQGNTDFISTDPDLLEIELGADVTRARTGARTVLRWQGIQRDLYVHPDVVQIQSIAAVTHRLMELGVDARLGLEVQP